MAKRKDKREANIHRITPEGKRVALTPKQEAAEHNKLRKVIQEGTVELAPGVAEQMAKLGISMDDIKAALLGSKKH